MQIAIGVHVRIPQVLTYARQEDLGFIVGPSQDSGEQSQRVGLDRHKKGTQVVPTYQLLHRIPRPATRRYLYQG